MFIFMSVFISIEISIFTTFNLNEHQVKRRHYSVMQFVRAPNFMLKVGRSAFTFNFQKEKKDCLLHFF